MPSCYLPCTLNRKLKLFPQLVNRDDVHTLLTSDSQLWDHLPPQFKAVTHPRLWSIVTLQAIVDACLAAVFNGCQQPVQCVGYWMVMAETKQQHREQQQQRLYPGPGFCYSWWLQNRHKVADMQHLKQQAAQKLFLNPPVQPYGKHELVDACMPMVTKSGKRKHIVVGGKYVYLVLQQASVGPCTVKVSVCRLIAWLFLGKPDAGHVVCHKDTTQEAAVVWAKKERRVPSNNMLFPRSGRCLSYTCVSPMCVFFDTQSANAKTGLDRRQLPARKGKRKGA